MRMAWRNATPSAQPSASRRFHGLPDPDRGLGVAYLVIHPPKDCDTVTRAHAQTTRVRCQCSGEARGVVVHVPSCVHDNSRDGFRVLAIAEEIGGYPRGHGHRNATENDPLGVAER